MSSIVKTSFSGLRQVNEEKSAVSSKRKHEDSVDVQTPSVKVSDTNPFALKPPPKLAPVKGIRNATTDGRVSVILNARTGAVTLSAGTGGDSSALGGQVGLVIGGRTFAIKTEPGDRTGETFASLQHAIRAAGYSVTDNTGPVIDSAQASWVIRK